MKKTMIFTILAALAVSLAGCSSAWPRCWWYRGDACEVSPTYDYCPTGSGQMIVPQASMPEVLPGPANTEPTT